MSISGTTESKKRRFLRRFSLRRYSDRRGDMQAATIGAASNNRHHTRSTTGPPNDSSTHLLQPTVRARNHQGDSQSSSIPDNRTVIIHSVASDDHPNSRTTVGDSSTASRFRKHSCSFYETKTGNNGSDASSSVGSEAFQNPVPRSTREIELQFEEQYLASLDPPYTSTERLLMSDEARALCQDERDQHFENVFNLRRVRRRFGLPPPPLPESEATESLESEVYEEHSPSDYSSPDGARGSDEYRSTGQGHSSDGRNPAGLIHHRMDVNRGHGNQPLYPRMGHAYNAVPDFAGRSSDGHTERYEHQSATHLYCTNCKHCWLLSQIHCTGCGARMMRCERPQPHHDPTHNSHHDTNSPPESTKSSTSFCSTCDGSWITTDAESSVRYQPIGKDWDDLLACSVCCEGWRKQMVEALRGLAEGRYDADEQRDTPSAEKEAWWKRALSWMSRFA